MNTNEADRIAALRRYDILDTPETDDFDQYTKLAATLCGTSTGLISLVDENRQWFKSRVGLDVRETVRDISFCNHTIHQESLLEVPDTLADPRFADNPLVTGPPFIRFYAGQPLVTADGLAIGTLCVIHHEPMQLQDNQRGALRVLAQSVMKLLELRFLVQREKQLNQELIEQNNFRKTLLESAGLAIISTNLQDQITSFNSGAEKILGYRADDVQGTFSLNQFVYATESDDECKPDIDRLMRQVDTNGPQTTEVYFRHRDGRVLPVELTISALYDANDVVIGHLVLGMDITERKLIYHAKSEFISLVSHELRTPLTSIRASLGLLEGGVLGALSDQVHTVIAVANRNCQRLMSLVDDILDMEKLASNKMSLRLERLNLLDLIRQSLEANHGYATLYQVTFVLQEPAIPCDVLADAGRLLQVVANLLSNAAKFSPPGGQVEIRMLAEGSQVKVEIEDHGAGIPLDFQPLIFSKFAQADHGNTRHQGGTGLGLNISRMLVEKMQGQIGFTTRIGQGSTFWIRLPIQMAGSGDSDGVSQS